MSTAWSVMIQVLFNSFASAGVILLVALGFNLIYSAARFFHFAHGAVLTSGAYFMFLFYIWGGLPFWSSLLLAVLVTALLGWGLDHTVYRELRRRKSSPLVQLLASLGLYIMLQNLISLLFGDSTRSLRGGIVRSGIDIWGARLTSIQLWIIFTSLLLVLLLVLLLRQTWLGKAIRAVADDPELANICGIDSDRVLGMVFTIGSALAGVAGILIALDVDMNPTMGMRAMMMGVVAVLVGGIGSIRGTAFGAMMLGLTQQTAAWFLSAQWQDTITFLILLIILVIKPEGFQGSKLQRVSV